MELLGIHHLTAISSRIQENYRFYTQTLGMRLVKRSVNQDDVSAYHLFYADAKGSPGTDLTFFDWTMAQEVRGSHSISRTALRVNGESALEWWAAHLADKAKSVGSIGRRDDRAVLDFEDTEGQRLTLIDDGGAGEAFPWEASPIEAQYQIRGLGPITISIPTLAPTDALLQQVLGMRPVRTYAHPENPSDTVHVYEMGGGGTGAELQVAVQPNLPPARQGAGGVHHVAFGSRDNDYEGWTSRLAELGIPNSGPVDRYWFRSLYFLEPNGVLFEIATEGPGFAVDEDEATLGEKIVLAPFLEPRRAEIISALKPLE